MGLVRVGGTAPDDLLQHAQHVGGSEHRAGDGGQRHHPVELESPGQHQEFTDKGVGPREGERTEREKGQEGHIPGHVPAHPGGQGQLTAVGALVDHAHAEEQGAGGDTVVDHLQDGALEPPGVEHKNAQGDKAHVPHRGVGDQLFHVLLGQGGEAAVDDAGDGQPQDGHGQQHGGVRGDRQAEAHQAVGAHFQQDRGQDHRAGGRRLDVGGRQPGVEREHRHLDREGQEKGEEDEYLEGERVLLPHHVRDEEAARFQVQGDECHQEQH